jgi:hypothetical protein
MRLDVIRRVYYWEQVAPEYYYRNFLKSVRPTPPLQPLDNYGPDVYILLNSGRRPNMTEGRKTGTAATSALSQAAPRKK